MILEQTKANEYRDELLGITRKTIKKLATELSAVYHDLDTQKAISGWAITIAVVLGLLHIIRFFI